MKTLIITEELYKRFLFDFSSQLKLLNQKPIGGVVGQNSTSSDFWEDKTYETYSWEDENTGEIKIHNPLFKNEDDEIPDYVEEPLETFVGAWSCEYDADEDRYYMLPDRNSSYEYAARYNPDHNTIQIIWSRYAISCRFCSPCYPGQGDIDSPGMETLAYCLPPELMSEEWWEENKDRIIKLPMV